MTPTSVLFAAAAEERLAAQMPLAARLRPRSLDEVVGQDALLAPGAPLRKLIEADTLRSVVLWGPPGTGKTTIAELIALHTSSAFERLSAVSAGVKDVRDVMARAEARLGERGERTILFLDEVHRFNKAQQDALLPAVESGLLTLIGATTENPYFELNAPPALPELAVPPRAHRHRRHPGAARPWPRRRGRHRRSRGPGPARRAGHRRRPPGAHRPRGLHRPHRPGAPRHHGPRRGRPRRHGAALRARRALRRRLRVHQEHPRLGPRGGRALPRPDDRSRRGRPLHRPPPRHPRQRGRRHGRPHGARGGRRRRPGRGVRRASPRPSSTWPRPRSTWRSPRSPTGRPRRSGRPGPTSPTASPPRSPCTCGTAIPCRSGRRGAATSTPTPTRGAGSSSPTSPSRRPGATTTRPATARRPGSPSSSRSRARPGDEDGAE